VNAAKQRRLDYIDYYNCLTDKYYSKGFPPAPFCKDVGVIQTDRPTCWKEQLVEWYEVEELGVARDFSCSDDDLEELINPTMMRPGSDQWHVHFTSNPIAAYLPFDRYVNVTDTIRYDTIGEFNVDSKAEYSTLSSTRTAFEYTHRLNDKLIR